MSSPSSASPRNSRDNSALELPPVSLKEQQRALEAAYSLMQGWREDSPSSRAAHDFVERRRGIPAHVWKEMIPCGVLPMGRRGENEGSRVLVRGLAETARGDMAAAGRMLESACQAGILIRRVPEINAAGKERFGAKWFQMGGKERAAGLKEIFEDHLRQGRDVSRFYSDYPVIVGEDSEGRTNRKYGHWLAVPLKAEHPETGEAVLAGFAYRSLRPLEETGPDYRHRRSRRNGFGDARNIIMGLADFRSDIEEHRAVALVEGTMDWLSLCAAYAAGGRHGVPPIAVQGVNLSPTEVETIAKATPRVIALLDFDSAGQNGTESLGLELLRKGTAVYVARATEEMVQSRVKDPSDVLARFGPEALVRMQTEARRYPLPVHEVHVRQERMKADPRLQTRRNQLKAASEVAMAIAAWPGACAGYIERTASALDLDPSTVEMMVVESGGTVPKVIPLSVAQARSAALVDTEPVAVPSAREGEGSPSRPEAGARPLGRVRGGRVGSFR